MVQAPEESPSTQPPPATASESPRPTMTRLLGPLAAPGVLLVTVLMFALALSLSLTYTSVAGAAAEAGNRGAAGYIEAAIGLGSVLGGIAWGRLRHRKSRAWQIGTLLSVLSGGILLGSLISSELLLLGIVLALAGVAIAPMFIVAYVAADEFSSTDQKTEAGTWVNTANNIGSAFGASAAGVLIETSGSVYGLVTAGCILAAAAALVTVLRGTINTSDDQSMPAAVDKSE
jgi:predicted MFS family arabinose efflux permease